MDVEKEKKMQQAVLRGTSFQEGATAGAGTVRLAGTKPENNFVGGDF